MIETIADYLGISIFIALIVAVLFLIFYQSKSGKAAAEKKKWILENGQKGEGEVISVSDTGVSFNDRFYNIKLRLKVTSVSGDEEISTSAFFSRANIPKVGDTIPFKFDPADKTKVIITADGVLQS